MPTVHSFDSTEFAYDASQCDDSVKDGDVLVVPSEHVVGVLVRAWPVAVTPVPGAFHTFKEGITLRSYEGGRYAASADLADLQVR